MMAFTCTNQDWDTAFLGYPVATITGEGDAHDFETMYVLLKKNYKLVYWFADPQQKTIAEHLGAHYVDTRITIELDLKTYPLPVHDSHIRIEKNPDDAIYPLLFECAVFSRFKKDIHFGDDVYRQLYTHWMKKAADEERLIVYTRENELCGFAIVSTTGDTAWFELMAVKNNFRHQGIGKVLSQAVNHYAQERGCIKLLGYIHAGNETVWRLHEQTGFKKIKTQLIYHFWL